jgi:hypothetical protein
MITGYEEIPDEELAAAHAASVPQSEAEHA